MSLGPKTSPTQNNVQSVPSFVKKTYTILQSKKFSDIISWNPEGSAFVINKPKEFCQKVLPAYFKHNQLTSFVRQLHLYGFERQKVADSDHVYSHILFQRDKEQLLAGIQRKKQNNIIQALQKTMQSKNQIPKENDTGLSYENNVLKKFHSDSLVRISRLESTVLDLTIQSQALWNFIDRQKERETELKAVLAQFITEYNFPIQELPSLLNEDLSSFSVPIGNKIPSGIPTIEDSGSNKVCSNCVDMSSFFNCEDEQGISTGGCSYSSPKASHSQENDEIKSTQFRSDDNLHLISSLFTKFNKDIEEKEQNALINKEQYHKPAPRVIDAWNLETQYLNNLSSIDQKANEFNVNKTEDSTLLGKRSFEGFQ